MSMKKLPQLSHLQHNSSHLQSTPQQASEWFEKNFIMINQVATIFLPLSSFFFSPLAFCLFFVPNNL
jgi:hypothetical protein